mgnify:CR=1 FL=1|jgi:predicted double-glycine peptidase
MGQSDLASQSESFNSRTPFLPLPLRHSIAVGSGRRLSPEPVHTTRRKIISSRAALDSKPLADMVLGEKFHLTSSLRKGAVTAFLFRSVLLFCVLVTCSLSVGCRAILNMQSSGAIVYVDGRPRINLLAVKQERRTDCGIACLSGVMNYWGAQVSADEIGAFLGPAPDAGYSLAQIKTYAEHAGFVAFLLQGSFEELKRQCDLGRPCIICVKNRGESNHSFIVYEVTMVGDDANLSIMDPASGRTMRISRARLRSRWSEIGSPLLLVGRKSADDTGSHTADREVRGTTVAP